MKIAFSTLGCPDFSWTDIYSMAKDFGFDGIEIRGLGDEIFAVKAQPFTESQLPETLEKLSKLRLEIPCLSSGNCLKFADKEEENYQELVQYIKLASKLGTPYVRVLGDLEPHVTGEVDDEIVLAALKRLIPVAEEHNVTLLIETNGVYADTERLCKLLNDAQSDAVAALWDVHHPFRFFNENPGKTVQNLGAYIKYIHIKDSVVEDGKVKYRMTGEGDLPIESIMFALRSINYEGYISLEWVKRWASELSDAGIVFPNFINYMSQFTEKSVSKGHLYYNNAGTGQYVWEKDTLIDLTFPQVLDRMVEEFPDQYCFRYTELDYTRTYSEFRDDVDTFARSLIALGVRPGDHVAIWATNVPQWFITFWATTKIGAVLVTVNTAYKIYEAEYLLRQSDTHTLVMIDGYRDSDYVGIMKELCPELETAEAGKPLHIKRLPFLRNIITIESKQKGCLSWDEAIALANRVPIEEVYRRAFAINKHDVCNMQYTSGTTGFPKGVMLTHYNVINNGKNIGDCMDLSTADRFLIHVPMFHCFGMVLSMTASMTHGATMSPITAFSPKKSLDCINREKITAVNGVPTMFIAMLEHEDFAKTDFSHMRTGIMAGSPCPVKVMQDVVDKMNMSQITIVFGQTESSPGCTQSRVDDPLEVRVNTVGRALPGIECKIVDPETGKDLPDNVDGEFVARGYNIMKGYYKMPEATAAAIDKDGWLHTGDIARRDENGNFKITGRMKDMIIRGGENIYPKEIEDFIYTHPNVRDVQVIGVPDQQYGEEIMACVILKEGMELTEDELKDYIRSHMAKHKTPRYIDFVTEFPMNAAGKILKYKMREHAVEKFGLQAAKNIVTA
ncbi:AMP-binding protein [Ruminiclostridium herbifermentans]|uniref:AMP-binding protein n=1 Tax=Ruminiclostridium herbifermentans TaxID=2488810 RepID=A0A4U7JH52_9FIRM|nr:AMP-binding protein [Ruminiclostridium herbifermentans]QNU66008.1 AMP-binding protein [Ruminiclostridium herbifermentans]